MACNPESLLLLAKSLQGSDASSEIHQRCSISRSYYAMYHKVLAILDCEPRNYPNKGNHGSLIHYLKTDAAYDESIDFKELKKLSYMLKQERDHRNLVDYELGVTVTQEQALRSIATAERCVDQCDALCANTKQSVG